MDLKSRKIGVFMGGFSSEREISLRSGKNVYEVLKKGGYHVIPVDVKDDLLEVLKREKVEIAFNVLHGEFGEDGKIQAILDFLKIPYTGSGVQASCIGLNKILTKQIVSLYGVHTAPFKIIEKAEDLDLIHFPLPWILKPQSEGSSVGIKIIRLKEDLKDPDFKNGNFFIEQYIEGTEVTVGVLDNGLEKIVLPVLQLVPKKEFYDYEAKYTEGMTDFILPAKIPEKLYEEVQKAALIVHDCIGCSGVTRSDFIVSDTTYFLEINTNPGMTDTSDIPAEARSYGLSDLELCEKILESSIPRFR